MPVIKPACLRDLKLRVNLADVVGRVTAVAMRLYLNDHTNLDRLPEQPEKS